MLNFGSSQLVMTGPVTIRLGTGEDHRAEVNGRPASRSYALEWFQRIASATPEHVWKPPTQAGFCGVF